MRREWSRNRLVFPSFAGVDDFDEVLAQARPSHLFLGDSLVTGLRRGPIFQHPPPMSSPPSRELGPRVGSSSKASPLLRESDPSFELWYTDAKRRLSQPTSIGPPTENPFPDARSSFLLASRPFSPTMLSFLPRTQKRGTFEGTISGPRGHATPLLWHFRRRSTPRRTPRTTQLFPVRVLRSPVPKACPPVSSSSCGPGYSGSGKAQIALTTPGRAPILTSFLGSPSRTVSGMGSLSSLGEGPGSRRSRLTS